PSAADHSLAILHWIPGEADLRTEILIRLPDAIAESAGKPKLIEQVPTARNQRRGRARNRRQVGVRASRIAPVFQTVGERQIGLDLPRIANVCLKPCVCLSA